MIKFACPGCQASFSVGDDKAGKTGKCPKCGSQFEIPQLDVASAVPPPPPPPPPPTPASAFAFDDEPPVPKKTKKTPSKADLDDDDKDDDDERDDKDDDDDDDTPKKAKPKSKTLTIIAGVLHILAAFNLLMCGVASAFSGTCMSMTGGALGGCFGAVAAAPTSNVKTVSSTVGTKLTFTTEKMNSEDIKREEDLRKDMKDGQKIAEGASNYGKAVVGTGICMILIGILAIPAAVGCFMRANFGKWLSYTCGPLIMLVKTVDFILMLVLLTGVPTMIYVVGCGFELSYTLYAVVTVMAALKGFPSSAEKAAEKMMMDEDEDEEEEPEEEEEEEKPAPKKKKKKVEEEDDEDDEPKPKKKKKRKDDDDDDD